MVDGRQNDSSSGRSSVDASDSYAFAVHIAHIHYSLESLTIKSSFYRKIVVLELSLLGNTGRFEIERITREPAGKNANKTRGIPTAIRQQTIRLVKNEEANQTKDETLTMKDLAFPCRMYSEVTMKQILNKPSNHGEPRQDARGRHVASSRRPRLSQKISIGLGNAQGQIFKADCVHKHSF